MSIFQFHIRDQNGLVLDEDGIELPDTLAAAQEAIQSVKEFIGEASPPTDMVIEVTDEAGRLVLIVPVRDQCRLSDEESPVRAA